MTATSAAYNAADTMAEMIRDNPATAGNAYRADAMGYIVSLAIEQFAAYSEDTGETDDTAYVLAFIARIVAELRDMGCI